ncbi:radical SAM protein [Aquicoccus sp. G2-2]|uniref:radical SAM protein n=1 Tax=Aquicoccus sp. G2-2 TaxID=3092120 RepID=UPI002AE004B2|nr:radical SAM protein [Aquicoccus sp. G2-2]MEA1113018.1 radical SAM protein [Aquicoccus sp. G2-2]
MKDQITANQGKFVNPQVTNDGSPRASVALTHPETLWFNTGTLCNIACLNCYIESSPDNDALVYLKAAEIADYLKQIEARNWPVHEIGFTGGEPFMNPEFTAMLRLSLEAGFDILVLTNAMRPMMRPRIQAELRALNTAFPGKMTLRISLDHHSARWHDQERGAGSFQTTLDGMKWLRDAGIRMAAAGRTVWNESEAEARTGYAALFARYGFDIDAQDPGQTVLFPEIDTQAEVPEITTACWATLNKSPEDIMCSSSRMVVKRKGAQTPTVLACTLIAYDPQFELGQTLEEAEQPVLLNHPHCAKFCVLGGGSCSA